MGVELLSNPYRSWDKSKLIDWEVVKSGTSVSRRRQLAAEQVERAGIVTLTDTLLNDDRGGVFVREIFADEEGGVMRDPRRVQMVQPGRRLFRLKWVRHQDGTAAKPGDRVEWKVGVLTRVPGSGAPMTTKIARSMRRRGESTEFRHAAILDEACCITVPFADASILLSRYGFETAKYKEKSGGQYNWLLHEVPDPSITGEVVAAEPAKRAGR